MISFILSLLGGLGLPAVLTGIAGKLGIGWLAKITGMDGIIGTIAKPIVALCIGLVDLLLEVFRWLVRKVLAGLDHITQSVPATFTALLLMWVAYGYGGGFGFWRWFETPVAKMERIAAPSPGDSTSPPAVRGLRHRTAAKTPGDWIRDALGVH